MQYISAKGDIIDVNLFKQSSYSIELNVFGSKVTYKPWHLSEGSIYDCICTASWGYYPRVATIKAATINQ